MSNKLIEFRNVNFVYNGKKILDNISFAVDYGEFVSIVGRNGSGKSVLTRHINGLLLPSSGDVLVDGINTKDDSRIYDIRKKIGFVFQDPDDQIVAPTVEEDIAFGLSNIGTPRDVMKFKIDEVLRKFNIRNYKSCDVESLSGGIKQKLAFVDNLVMEVSCLVLDEPTSMLDQESRTSVIDEVLFLNKKYKIAIILLTHHMDEAKLADKTIILKDGKIISQGSPNIIDTEFINNDDLNILNFSKDYKISCNPLIELRGVSYKYDEKSEYIIQNLDFKVFKNEIIIITGKNGSGKSTLAKILSGIIFPNSGEILFKGEKIKKYALSKKVKIVFQSSENQLFAETVLEDVCFGPRNMGLSDKEAEKLAIESLEKLEFDMNKVKYSPFELSGGEKKIVSIAGIFAMDPEVIILDEPTAGLDFFAKKNLIKLIFDLNRIHLKTMIVVSHSYELFQSICKNYSEIDLNGNICKIFRL